MIQFTASHLFLTPRANRVRFGGAPQGTPDTTPPESQDRFQLTAGKTSLLPKWLEQVPVLQPVRNQFLLTDRESALVDDLMKTLPRFQVLSSQVEKAEKKYLASAAQMELAGMRYIVSQLSKTSPTMMQRMEAAGQGEALSQKERSQLMAFYGDSLEKNPQPFIYLLDELRKKKSLIPEEEAFLCGFLSLYQLASQGSAKSVNAPDLTHKLADQFKKELQLSETLWTAQAQAAEAVTLAEKAANTMASATGDVDFLQAKAQKLKDEAEAAARAKIQQDAAALKKAQDELLNNVAFRDQDLGDITGLRLLNIINEMGSGLFHNKMSVAQISALFSGVPQLSINKLLYQLMQNDYLGLKSHLDRYDYYMVDNMTHSYYANSESVKRFEFYPTSKAKQALKQAKQG